MCLRMLSKWRMRRRSRKAEAAKCDDYLIKKSKKWDKKASEFLSKRKAPELPKVSEIDLNVKHRVTRFDFYDAVLTALMDTHPKIKNHPAIKDFVRRAEACEQEGKKLEV